MNGRSGFMLLIAVVCGLAAMFGVRTLLKKDNRAEATREVLAAARDLKVEEVLKPELVKVVKVPESTLPAGAFSSFKDVADRWVRMPMLEGEPIVEGKLAPKDAPVGLLSRIPEGMRAFAIEVNEQSGVSGFVMPDHRVDVLLARQNRTQNRPQSEIILEDVLVLAAGTVTTRPEDKSIQVRTVTIAVTPDQVARLVAAKTEGTLSLSLRGLNDHAQVRTKLAEEESQPEPTRPILVASGELRVDTELIPSMVKVQQVPQSALLPADIVTDPSQIVGRKVKVMMAAGEPVLVSKLKDPKEDVPPPKESVTPDPNIAAIDLSPDCRAVPIRLEDIYGGSDHASRGDWVDVIHLNVRRDPVAAPPGGQPGQMAVAVPGLPADPASPEGLAEASQAPAPTLGSTAPLGPSPATVQTADWSTAELILQRVRVLRSPWQAGAASPTPSPGLANVLVLEVPAIDVPKLIASQGTGKLMLTLRHPEDDGHYVMNQARMGVIHHGGHRRSERELFQVEPSSLERRSLVIQRPGIPRAKSPGLLSTTLHDPAER